MKRIGLFLMLVLGGTLTSTVFAQKTTTTTVSYQNTQARMPQVLVQPLVQPLVVEARGIKDAPTSFKITLSAQKVADLGSGATTDIESIHNYGVFKFAESTNADMIVGATYDLHTIDNGSSYELVIRGFPARFENWHTATKEDYEWMQLTGTKGAENPVVRSVK